ncbi:hypothetical protein Tco_1123005 [Tanacetum coccineum]|uniref:Uncharacterized protein n=1 Tax=Tanacetum coccineum TaxID=301880 RepID=A0ABQ5J3T8_9ASTR
MVVQNQAELGKGSAIPTDPHHTPTIIESSSQPQKTQKPRKPKRKDTRVPQPSDPSDNVADEAVHKELGDNLVRAATTVSSLEAEQDSGNITKTQSKVTPNESNSLGTTLGGGPKRQETIGDTIAQTRFKNVSKLSNESLLARGNTLQSDEDRLKLNELMELCTTLQKKVLDLEKTKTTQANEIASLKRRVKKLEKKRSSRTHKLKRLYKVGLSARVESSGDEEDLGEDASKQGRRINVIDADEDITLVNDDADKEMFDVDALNGEEVFVAGQNENVVEEIVHVAQVRIAATTVTITTEEITLAQALADLKSTKPKAKGIAFREPGESTTTIFSQQLQDKGLSQDKGKGILVEPKKPLKKKDQLKFDAEIALKLQAEIDEEERIARAEEEKIDEANIAWDDIQANVDVDYQLAKRLQAKEQEQFIIEEKITLFIELLEQRRKHFAAKRAEEKRNKPPTKTQQKKIMITHLNNIEETTEVDDDQEATKIKELMEIVPDEEEIAIDVIPLAVKSPRIVDWKIHKEGNKSYYQIVRADGKSQMYLVFSHMLKSFDKEYLEVLYKLVKARYGSTRPVEDLDLVLWNDLKNMFEPHVEDVVWRNQQGYKVLEWKLYDSYMLEKKIQIDYESEIAYQMSKLLIKQLKKVTAALIGVNVAQSKLVLLENFNENYSKCLRLLYKVNAASEEVSTAEKVFLRIRSIKVVSTIPNVDKDELRLYVFSKSLSGDAEKWWNCEGIATTWKELCDKLFHKYYPLSHTYKSKIPDDLGHGTDYFEFLYWLASKFDNDWEVDKDVKSGLWEFYVNGRTNGMINDLVNYNEPCEESNEKTCSNLFFKPYLDAQDGKDNYEIIDRDYSPIPIPVHHNISNPNELCQTKEFTVIRNSVGSCEEYITVEETPSIMSCIYHELFNKKDHG